MNLVFSSFAEPRNLATERIILKALKEVDIGDYAIFRSIVSEGSPTPGWKGAYWFPDITVNANDLIVLYTKGGSHSTKALADGRTAHFFYWGRDEAMWGDKRHGAVIVLVSEWAFHTPGSKTPQ